MEITKRELKSFEDRKFPDKICFNPIGIIHTEFKSLKGIPIQFSMSDSKGCYRNFSSIPRWFKRFRGIFSYLLHLLF